LTSLPVALSLPLPGSSSLIGMLTTFLHPSSRLIVAAAGLVAVSSCRRRGFCCSSCDCLHGAGLGDIILCHQSHPCGHSEGGGCGGHCRQLAWHFIGIFLLIRSLSCSVSVFLCCSRLGSCQRVSLGPGPCSQRTFFIQISPPLPVSVSKDFLLLDMGAVPFSLYEYIKLLMSLLCL
jgi:hypothetical protein